MAKIARKNLKIFAADAGSSEVGVIGGLRANTLTYSKDPDVLQQLPNYSQGYYSTTIDNNSPAMEEENALNFLFSYMVAYLYQNGIPEWNAETEYYKGSLVKDSNGTLLSSKTDANINKTLLTNADWTVYGTRAKYISADYTILPDDEYIFADSQGFSTNITVTLPDVNSVPLGKTFVIKNYSTASGQIVNVSSSAKIDDRTSFALMTTGTPLINPSITVMRIGEGTAKTWFVTAFYR